MEETHLQSTAIQSRSQEDPDQEYDLPNTIQALLWACCSPHDFGMPEVSPLCEALRAGDDTIVSLLLQYRASPSRREEGSNDPIFVAIQMSSAENVHRLLQYSADPRSREAVPSREFFFAPSAVRPNGPVSVEQKEDPSPFQAKHTDRSWSGRPQSPQPGMQSSSRQETTRKQKPNKTQQKPPKW